MFQFIIYGLVSIVPGISKKTLYFGVEYFMDYYNFRSDGVLDALVVVIWLLYLAHVLVHHNRKFNSVIWYLLVIESFATTTISYSSLFHYAFLSRQRSIADIIPHASPILYMALTVFLFPFVLSLALSGNGHSFMQMVKSVIQYMLFIPLLVGSFGAYSYSRPWDLTWGNRPGTAMSESTSKQKETMIKKFKEKSRIIIVCLAVANIVVYFLPIQGQTYLMGAFFTIAIFQMGCSLIYCLTKVYYKCQMAQKEIDKDKSFNPEKYIDNDKSFDTEKEIDNDKSFNLEKYIEKDKSFNLKKCMDDNKSSDPEKCTDDDKSFNSEKCMDDNKSSDPENIHE